jgi:hypothetical protein
MLAQHMKGEKPNYQKEVFTPSEVKKFREDLKECTFQPRISLYRPDGPSHYSSTMPAQPKPFDQSSGDNHQDQHNQASNSTGAYNQPGVMGARGSIMEVTKHAEDEILVTDHRQ